MTTARPSAAVRTTGQATESHDRRIKLEDVLAFQARRARRAEGRYRIADIAAAADLPYLRISSNPA
jgi:hypothetical protein